MVPFAEVVGDPRNRPGVDWGFVVFLMIPFVLGLLISWAVHRAMVNWMISRENGLGF